MSSTLPTDASEPASGPTRWRLDLRYDGRGFAGWAVQPGQRTVQGELEQWLGRVLRLEQPVHLVCAGRTDAGVHARGQVAHVDLPPAAVPGPGDQLRRRLQRALPDDLAVIAAAPAPPHFDARFAAIWRRYCYRIADGAARPDPLLRQQVLRSAHTLDLEAINAAGADLIGLRDFAPFCRRRAGATTIRTLLELRADRVWDGPFATVVEFTIRADAFCHSMVRSLVGGLVEVGSGRRDPAWLARVAQTAERASAVPVLPAGGLTLEEVGYPPDEQFAERVLAARTRRELSSD
jgi:tRNA pseudouridine38-40 synthase